MFPEEYQAFKWGMNAVRAQLKDEEFGTMGSKHGARALYEMPENLQTMLIMGLSEEEMIWLKSGIKTNPNQGGRWFANTFKEFRIPSKV